MSRQGLLIFEEISGEGQPLDFRVAGLSLLDRSIRTMARAGLERLAVILPAAADLRLTRLTQKLDLTIEFLTWESASSLVLPADSEVLVLLGDRVHHHSSLTQFVENGLEDADLVVQTSAAPHQEGPFIRTAIGSETTFTEATEASGPVGTGAFLCSSNHFAQKDIAAGRFNFHTFLQEILAGKNSIERASSSPLWRRVWDRRSVRSAKKMLFGQVTKPTSGFVSRHLNARISIPISKLLVETGMSPHVVTVLFVMTTGLTSAYLISFADDYPTLLLAGFLWQMAAVLDRCDGEIARVKLCESKFGAWFDTVTDNLAYICAYIGLLFGMRKLYPDTMFYWYLGLSAIAAFVLTLAILYIYARRSGSGSLQHYLRDLNRDLPDSEKTWVQTLMQRYGVVGKRDFFSFVVFLTTIVNRVQISYWFIVVISYLAVGGVLLSQRKMLKKAARISAQRSVPTEDRR